MNNNFYKAPESSTILDSSQGTSFTGKWLAIVGAFLLMGLPVGLLATLFSIIETFQSITLYGTGDPKVMAGGISEGLVSTVLGIVIALPGAVLLAISVFLFKHRRPWVYRVSFTAAIFTFLLFPIGTILSIFILVKLRKSKDSFFTPVYDS